jgi:hypothetical protein
MPQINGKGPDGTGPKTGRGLGLCKNDSSNKERGELGKGLGMRRKSGGGSGNGKRLKSGIGNVN